MLVRLEGSVPQPIAGFFCHQDLCPGGIAFDFLSQPVDVSLDRMGRGSGAVAPDFAQQDVTVHGPLQSASLGYHG